MMIAATRAVASRPPGVHSRHLREWCG
jgi:hypothetical protein